MFSITKKGTKMRITLFFVMLVANYGNLFTMQQDVPPIDFAKARRVVRTQSSTSNDLFVHNQREMASEKKFNEGSLERRPSAPRELSHRHNGSSSRSRKKQ